MIRYFEVVHMFKIFRMNIGKIQEKIQLSQSSENYFLGTWLYFYLRM